MGRKRKRTNKVGNPTSKTEHKGAWPEAIVEELLAYLDSGVAFLDPETKAEIERKDEDINEEISQHLNEVYEDGKDSPEPFRQFSPTQVRDKLRRLFWNFCKDEMDGRKWKIIYRLGSSCLTNTKDPEVKDRIARLSGAIKIKWVECYLRSPRKTRASSQLNRETYQSPRRSTSASDPSLMEGSRLRGQDIARHHPLRQRYTASENDNESDISSISDQQEVASQVKLETAGIERNLADIANSTSEKSLSSKDSQLSMSQEPEVYGTPSARLTPFSDCEEERRIADVISAQPSSDLIQRLSRFEAELSTFKEEAAMELDFWKARCHTVDEKNAKLKRERDALVVKLGMLCETNTQLTVDDFLTIQAEKDELEEEIRSRREVQTLKRGVGVNVEKQTFLIISKLMQDISSHLQGALKRGSFVPLLSLPELPREHPLRSLVEQAFGFDWSSNDASHFLEECRHNGEMQQISMLSLSGAALAQWVFNRSQADLIFDRYQNSSSRCSTNRYRHAINILAMEYPEFARAIDLEVHTKIAQEESFKHFQESKARSIALHLQEVLAPLWNGASGEASGDGTESESGSDVDITEQLTSVFDKALDVQCRLALTGHQYECVWYPPGHAFDEDKMNPYRSEDMRAVLADTSTTRLTLIPGISQVVDGQVGVDFGGFADSRQCLQGHAVCLVQPLVWLGCSQ